MTYKGRNFPRRRILTVFLILSIVLISFLSYRDVLGFFFTASDSFTLIDTSRIQSCRDVERIFSEPLMNGTGFVEIAKYYRPVTALSFSLDYSIWKLNPLGYHLSNLILHILVSILVFFFIRFLTKGKQITAWLGALIFTTHPIIVESVPAIARRQDIIVALFLLLSLLSFMKYLSTLPNKRVFLVFSVFFYALALGAKEIAIILPFLIFTFLIIFSFSDEKFFKSFKTKLLLAIKRSLPYFIVTLILLAWRIYVLRGIGGFVNRSLNVFGAIQSLINIIRSYFMGLVDPVDLLSSLFNPFPTTFEKIVYLIVLISFFLFLLFYGKAIFKFIKGDDKGKRVLISLKIFLALLVIILLIGILSYPLISPYLHLLINQAYGGDGPQFLIEAMKGWDNLAVEHYFYKFRNLFLDLSFFLLFLSVIFLIGIHRRDKIKFFFSSSYNGKLVLFWLIWISLPLIVYLLTINFSHRNMYISVIPLSAILCVGLIENFQSMVSQMRKYHFKGSSSRSPLLKFTAISSILIIALLASFLVNSPLVRTYGEWEESGKMSSMFLSKLSEIAAELPNTSVINIYNFPNGISVYETKIPHVKEVGYLAQHSIKSWLDLNYPTKNLEVAVQSVSKLKFFPNDLDLEIKTEKDKKVMIIINVDNNSGT